MLKTTAYLFLLVAKSVGERALEEVSPSNSPSNYPELISLGLDPNIKLGICQGDCDLDSECEDGLVCVQRDPGDDVPGCSGDPYTIYDYCLPPPSDVPVVEDFGFDPGVTLGLCQGNCFTDSDCEDGLICWTQRTSTEEPVPGCAGTGELYHFYCIMGPPTPGPAGVPSGGPPGSPTLPVLVSFGPDPDIIMGLCQGDCDDDTNCQDGLICVQRDIGDDVPGCSGDPYTNYDYCLEPPSDVPVLEDFGLNPGFTLGLCQGDCNVDSDCEDGLVCWQRAITDPVPYCSGSGVFHNDYCIPGLPTPAPAGFPSGVPPSTTLPVLESLGPDPTGTLGLCQGDCDFDSDCEDGLICDLRDFGEDVPGCSGDPYVDYDYCLKPPSDAPGLEDFGVFSGLTLGLCQGDCNYDTDCEVGLLCWQRSGTEPVPGCSGTGMLSYDYCIVGVPTPAPVAGPPTLPVLQPWGEDPNFPLGICQGDCDDDRDCQSGLFCVQRDIGDDIPFCSGDPFGDYDYCLELPPGTPVLEDFGITPGFTLGVCQGDCDYDGDCEDGLYCFQRETFAISIPGCFGSGIYYYDYCAACTDSSESFTINKFPEYSNATCPRISRRIRAQEDPFEIGHLVCNLNVDSNGGDKIADICIETCGTYGRGVCAITPAFEGVLSEGLPSSSSLPLLISLGPNPNIPLGICQGNCNQDSNCQDGLICVQRDIGDDVPGCSGDPYTDYDYCLPPPSDVPVLEDFGLNPGFTLGLCQGDCNWDFDCEDGLVCWERSGADPVPYCSGSGVFNSDYCIPGLPTPAPAGVPSGGLPSSPTLPVLESLGRDPKFIKLGLCQGDCDFDNECEDGLICVERDFGDDVPGCSGDPYADFDYCLEPPPGLPVLEEFGLNPDFQLGLCQGDCDSDSDCEDGLVCWDRAIIDPVPYCSGTGRYDFDYCIPGLPTPAPAGLPSGGPPSSPTLPVLESLDRDPTVTLGLCQGDCDFDSDCEDGLICVERDFGEDVTGCSGDPYASYDYCLEPPPDIPVLEDFGLNPGFTLGRCEGDCNFDSDCEDGLLCWQRSGTDPVPGCIGTGVFNNDYCIVGLPTPAPVAGPPTLPVLQPWGEDPNFPLRICQGDCDYDDDCQDGLICVQRDVDDDIPDCSGVPFEDYDYCLEPPPGLPVLEDFGYTPGITLGVCQGDCDTNSECEDGLYCFQRVGYTPIPGCSGSGVLFFDYCAACTDSLESFTITQYPEYSYVSCARISRYINSQHNPSGAGFRVCSLDVDSDGGDTIADMCIETCGAYGRGPCV